ncbi:hypothetical protein LRS74_29780 [Streptomyces sp. LX-29]|uniref:hypothetical protein n=1 Tax=Streptomyces sp. LX-29 TaxID=2900152 RepID=UPI00240D7822|nr:hypothetical protein [Streptomyces sp. LX-29]WFB10764.1 hypothetical protein LRS74_29780 [Streptomyces sp. LX-29]
MSIHEVDGGILHALRVAGWLGAERFPAWGVAEPEDALTRLVEAGRVRLVRSPRGEMYGLTPEGTEAATSAVAAWLAGLDPAGSAALGAALAGFEAHDGALKHLVTRYQAGARDTVGQDLRDFHEQARGALDAVVSAAPLWASYPERLENALLQVEKGELDHVASPLLESYHTVWHLAHRDMRLVCEARRP